MSHKCPYCEFGDMLEMLHMTKCKIRIFVCAECPFMEIKTNLKRISVEEYQT